MKNISVINIDIASYHWMCKNCQATFLHDVREKTQIQKGIFRKILNEQVQELEQKLDIKRKEGLNTLVTTFQKIEKISSEIFKTEEAFQKFLYEIEITLTLLENKKVSPSKKAIKEIEKAIQVISTLNTNLAKHKPLSPDDLRYLDLMYKIDVMSKTSEKLDNSIVNVRFFGMAPYEK